jgi:hypothetical protein
MSKGREHYERYARKREDAAYASARDVNNRYPAIAFSTIASGSPCTRATAAVLEDFDNFRACLVLANGSRAEDADIVFIQRAHAAAIDDGLANDLVGHG